MLKTNDFFNVNVEDVKSDVYQAAAQSFDHNSIGSMDFAMQAEELEVSGCLGTAGTYGSLGTATGCAGTFGSLGSYGCLTSA